MKISRQKENNLLFSLMYRLQKFLPLNKEKKFKLFLDLEWMFDRLSHEMSYLYYPRQKHPIFETSINFILENIRETDTVLDLGCSQGHISFAIAQKAKEVTGIDYDKTAIEFAKQQYSRGNLTFHNSEANEFLRNNSGRFNVLILSHVLEHIDEPKSFLTNFKNHFDRIYIEVPDFDKTFLNHYRKHLGLTFIYTDRDHVWEFDRYELHTLLSECNIKIQKEEHRLGMQRLWCSTNEGNH